MADPLDIADLNPAFAPKVRELQQALTNAGIANQIISGYRTPEYQNQMYQNHLAKQAGRPLPYPNVEAPSVVAPPWSSFHNYGLAADFSLPGGQYAQMARMAPQFGLTGIGPSDPGHIQLAGGLDQDIAQYHLAGWRPQSYPTPQNAIAYNRGGAIVPPSNQVASAAPGPGPIAPVVPSTPPVAGPPGQPARPFTPTPGAVIGQASPGSAQPPTWQQTVGGIISKLTQPDPATGKSKLQDLQKTLGGGDQQQQGGGEGDQQQGQMQQAMGGQPDPRLLALAQQSPQLLAAILQKSQQPLSWAARPYGSDAGPQIPGTTLTSMGG